MSVRQNAGRTEQYLIRLTAEQFIVAGIPLPTTPSNAVEEPGPIIDRLVAGGVRENTIIDGVRIVDQSLRAERVRKIAFEHVWQRCRRRGCHQSERGRFPPNRGTWRRSDR